MGVLFRILLGYGKLSSGVTRMHKIDFHGTRTTKGEAAARETAIKRLVVMYPNCLFVLLPDLT